MGAIQASLLISPSVYQQHYVISMLHCSLHISAGSGSPHIAHIQTPLELGFPWVGCMCIYHGRYMKLSYTTLHIEASTKWSIQPMAVIASKADYCICVDKLIVHAVILHATRPHVHILSMPGHMYRHRKSSRMNSERLTSTRQRV